MANPGERGANSGETGGGRSPENGSRMRVVVFLPNWVGDVVMTTPAVRALREHLAPSRLVGVLRPYVADVLGGSPWFDELVPADRRVLPLAARLRRERVDLAVLFVNSFRAALAAWLGGCRRRVGFARYGRGPLLTDRLHM